MVKFADEAQSFSFGFEIDGQAKVTKRYEFGDDKRWIGLHGVESSTGIVKLGIITMNPLCAPIGGEVKIIEPIEPIEEEVVVEVVKVPEPEAESGLSGAIVAVLIVVLLCVLVGSAFLFLYLRKRKMERKLNQLDKEDAETS